MIGIENNLYPPQTSTWMPAFVRTQPCRVYFSLSIYNVKTDIGNAQVVVNDQNTNASVLNPTKYPTGIMITQLQEDPNRRGNDKYYIEIIPKIDIEGGQFEINKFYKVQIRFTSINAPQPPEDGKVAGWLIDNQKFFSEWSRVCLIRGISQPTVYLRNFENVTDDNQIVQFSTFNINFVGSLQFENAELEKETLKSYRFYIYDESSDELIFDSGEIFTNYYEDPNQINYLLTYLLEENINYRLNLSYTTYNEYTNRDYIKHFSVVEGNLEEFDARITVTPNVDLGCMSINVFSDKSVMMVNNLVIRRSSNESNFTLWEDIHFDVVANEPTEHLDYTWNDYTVKSGIFYRYAAQTVNTQGERSFAVLSEHGEMIVFDDMFLTRDNMQVRLRYDPNISSFKRTISESLTETIGSKYPYFRRNGSVCYKQFPIAGLITWFCDEEGVFINKDKIYKGYVNDYNNYNLEENIDEYQDYIYEREFREKVMDFLYENTIKLFRSTTEGNILVKLMDINFTPNQTLGRMLYSFSAMAYEVDECTLANYEKYGILSVGTYSQDLTHTYGKVGQWQGVVKANEDLFNLVQEKYNSMVDADLINTLEVFRAIKLEFSSDPYLIEDAGGGVLKPWTKTSDATESGSGAENLAYGYLVYINNTPIIVSPRGYYELSDEGTAVTSITFPLDTDVDFNYVAVLTESENSEKIAASKYYYSTIAGQQWGSFDIDQSVVGAIYMKYKTQRKDFYTKLLSVDYLAIESAPGAVIYVKDAFDTDYYRHVVGPTGTLRFYNKDTVITNAYIYGMHLVDHDGNRNEVRDEEFINTGITVDSIDDIENPIKNGVYTIKTMKVDFTEPQEMLLKRSEETVKDPYLAMMKASLHNESSRYIYYHSQWYIFTDNHDVMCPIDATIDYICETVKGEY